MTELKIDITGTPPVLGQIEAWRESAQRDAANADAVERNIVRWCWVVACVAGVMLAGLWYYGGWIGGDKTVAVVGVVALVGALVGAVAVVVAVALVGASVGALVGALVGAVAVAVAVAGAVVGAVVGAVAGDVAVAGALAGGGVVAVVVAGVVAWGYDKWVATPRTRSRAILEVLTDLTPDDYADKCTTYFKWFEEDETVQRYQRQVATQGRSPIIAEYLAAKSWVGTADERRSQTEKVEEARVACERLRTAGL